MITYFSPSPKVLSVLWFAAPVVSAIASVILEAVSLGTVRSISRQKKIIFRVKKNHFSLNSADGKGVVLKY